MIPEVDSAEEAGRLLENLPALWAAATLDERHDLATSMLDAVYLDLGETKSVLAIKPKPPFAAVFSIAAARAGSGVELLPKEKPRRNHRGVIQICVSGGDGGGSAVHYLQNTLRVRIRGP